MIDPERTHNQPPGEPLVSELEAAANQLSAGKIVPNEVLGALLRRASIAVTEFGDMAYTDHLTQLASARYFEQFVLPNLERYCAGERRRGSPETYMIGIADINGLKYVNETQDYEAGDRLIQDVGARIKQLLRPEDIVVRHGDRADEFIMVLPMDGIDAALFPKVAEVIAARLNSDSASVAIGFTMLDTHASVASALAAAQTIMMRHKYRQKQNGTSGHSGVH